MKTQSNSKLNKSKLVAPTILGILVVVLVEFLSYKAHKAPPPLIYELLIFIVFFIVFFSILYDEYDEDEDLNISGVEESDFLIWTLMAGPSTWEEAAQMAEDKGDDWQLPTAKELRDKISKRESSGQFWTKDRNQILSTDGSYQLVPPDARACYYLVRKV